MGTGLQCDIGCGTPGSVSGLFESLSFRMRPPTKSSPAPANNPVILNNDTAHCRVGRGLAKIAPGQGQGMAHMKEIIAHR